MSPEKDERGMPVNYPTVQDVITAMVDVFNAETYGLNLYSENERRLCPINVQDIANRTDGIRGRSPRVMDECRLLCYFTCARYTMVWDAIMGHHRLYRHREIGQLIGKRKQITVQRGVASCCGLLANDEAYRFLLHSALRSLKARGFAIWNEPKTLQDQLCA